jgi:hypothetical protein
MLPFGLLNGKCLFFDQKLQNGSAAQNGNSQQQHKNVSSFIEVNNNNKMAKSTRKQIFHIQADFA